MQCNEVLLADSLAASRTPVCSKTKEAITAPPMKSSAGMAGNEKKGFLWKGFLNTRRAVIAPTTPLSLPIELASSSTQEVKDDGVVWDNGFSQSNKWHVGFDLSREVIVWEQDDEFWDGMPLD